MSFLYQAARVQRGAFLGCINHFHVAGPFLTILNRLSNRPAFLASFSSFVAATATAPPPRCCPPPPNPDAATIAARPQDTAKLVQRNGGKAPLTMGSFQKLVDGLGPPPPPAADPPHVLPPPAPGAKGADAPSTSVPTWQEMGFSPDEPPTAVFKGGESEALSRLAKCLEDEKWVAGFEKPATDPSAFVKPATTVLSPYLKFGCLSPRLFHAKLADVYKRHKVRAGGREEERGGRALSVRKRRGPGGNSPASQLRQSSLQFRAWGTYRLVGVTRQGSLSGLRCCAQACDAAHATGWWF